MVRLRIETVLDEKSGRYFLEVYMPEDATAPMMTTAPVYKTQAAAENDLVAALAVFPHRREG